MSPLRQNLLPTVLVIAGIAIGVEVWVVRRAMEEAARAVAALEVAKQERDWLARQSPAPTIENEAALAADVAALRGRVATLRAALEPRAPAPLAAPVPAKAMDAFFELANLVERSRAQASANRITLRPDERFGFATYANEGPAVGTLGPVHRQQLAVQALLEPLFEARPLAVLSVKRQPVATAGQVLRTGGEDFFSFEPALSLRGLAAAETEAVRMEFTGQTSTLRDFLGGVAGLRHPAIVRSIEVEPVAPTGAPRAGSDSSVPVVRQSLSKFAVTVEFVLLPPDPPKPAS